MQCDSLRKWGQDALQGETTKRVTQNKQKFLTLIIIRQDSGEMHLCVMSQGQIFPISQCGSLKKMGSGCIARKVYTMVGVSGRKSLKMHQMHLNLLNQKHLLYLHSNTIKLWAVDWSIIQFWSLLAKDQSTKASYFPLKNSLKILKCATNRDSLLLATLQYLIYHLQIGLQY